MYLEKAIKRISSICKMEWTDDKDTIVKLVNQYLIDFAVFFHNENLEQFNPIYANISYFLGDHRDINLEHYCNIDPLLSKRTWYKYFMIRHVQLAELAENNTTAEKYVNIYDPIITLIEKGCDFVYRHGFWEFYGYFAIPMHGWYKRYLIKAKEKGLII